MALVALQCIAGRRGKQEEKLVNMLDIILKGCSSNHALPLRGILSDSSPPFQLRGSLARFHFTLHYCKSFHAVEEMKGLIEQR